MRQIVLNIPENNYAEFINLVKEKFADIQIKEKLPENKNQVMEDDTSYDTMLLSEKSLAEDWLTEEDNRWDQVL